jgi:Gpi18-like mannosyltransferase
LFLPTVVMNSALWGQCDILYATCLLASLFHLLQGRPVAMLVAFGLSASLKPQAIFWCPLLAGLLLSGRLPWRWLWVPPAVYVMCGIPAMLAGEPVANVLLHWGRVENSPGLTLGATNWYQWLFEHHPDIFWWPGVVLTLVATMWFALWMLEGPGPGQREREWLVSLALLSVLFPPFLLPGMHERYFFAADVLSVVYAACVARGWQVAALIQFASAFAYLPFLFSEQPVPRWILALVMLAALALVTVRLMRGSTQGTSAFDDGDIRAK